jgi:hypothetical protein
MTTTPETWTRYPRSTDPAKDVVALVARVQTLKATLMSVAILGQLDGPLPAGAVTRALSLADIINQEHQEWIAQRGVEAVRTAVMPEDAL